MTAGSSGRVTVTTCACANGSSIAFAARRAPRRPRSASSRGPAPSRPTASTWMAPGSTPRSAWTATSGSHRSQISSPSIGSSGRACPPLSRTPSPRWLLAAYGAGARIYLCRCDFGRGSAPPKPSRRFTRTAAAAPTPAPAADLPGGQDHVGRAADREQLPPAVGDRRLAERDRPAAPDDPSLGEDLAFPRARDEAHVQIERGLADAARRALVHRGERPAHRHVDQRAVDAAVHGRARRVADVVAHADGQADPAFSRVSDLDAQVRPEQVGAGAFANGGQRV